MNAWFIYGILKLDTIETFTHLIATLSFMVLIGAIPALFVWKYKKPVYSSDYNADRSPSDSFIAKQKAILKISKRGIIACIILIFINLPLAVLLPSTQQACVIYLLPKIVNNENIQKIPNNVSELMNKRLEQWMDDVKGNKK